MVSRPQCHLGWLSEEPTPSPHLACALCPQVLHSISILSGISTAFGEGRRQLLHISLPPEQPWNGIFLPPSPLEEEGSCLQVFALPRRLCLVKLCLFCYLSGQGWVRKLNLPPTFYLPEMIYSLLGGGCCGLYDPQPTLWFGICSDLCSFPAHRGREFLSNPVSFPSCARCGSCRQQGEAARPQSTAAASCHKFGISFCSASYQLAKLGHSQVVFSPFLCD